MRGRGGGGEGREDALHRTPSNHPAAKDALDHRHVRFDVVVVVEGRVRDVGVRDGEGVRGHFGACVVFGSTWSEQDSDYAGTLLVSARPRAVADLRFGRSRGGDVGQVEL